MKVRVVGMAEVAALMGVKLRTVHQWRFRGVLPAPDFVVNQGPAWKTTTILKWAESTGRKVAS